MNKLKKSSNQQGEITIKYNSQGSEMLKLIIQIPIVCSVGAYRPT